MKTAQSDNRVTRTSAGAAKPCPNPKRVAAGRLNRMKSKGLTPAGREKLRQSALQRKPWLHSTGPRTPEGKARAAQNSETPAKQALRLGR